MRPGRLLVAQMWRGPARWWARQSLRARLTLVATALFAVAVATGAVLLLVLQRYALTRVLDAAASKNVRSVSRLVAQDRIPPTIAPTTGGVAGIQVLSADDRVLSSSLGTAFTTPLLTRDQLTQVRAGHRLEFDYPGSGADFRVVSRNVGPTTVVAYTDVSRINDSQRILTRAALIGGPLAVLVMAVLTYAVVALTLRSVAALRHGAAAITAAGLAEQRLPVPGPQDEIHRLAVTLNAMLDRIDSATSRQRTFVGDAAHELRSPIASLRVQLEVAQRLGPTADWPEMIDDVMVDVERLDRLVNDLLALARLDESSQPTRRHPLDLDELAAGVVAENSAARVAVRPDVSPAQVVGDPEALRRVVVNLVNNAVRYAMSEVVVSVRPGDPVVLSVLDDGPGIPPAEQERVFDRFYRVQESRSRETGGTGLGLPIVRDIVRAHGGTVVVTSRPDGHPGLHAVVEFPPAP